jgi:A/G-specific adenine glycosylase
MRSFAARVVAWQRIHGRTDLPWQGRDPYRVWVSEIMLQQTQVRTVVPYFERFMRRFPDLHALASAPLDEVMRLWAGLGYYSRARNLHAGAQQVERACGGVFPRTAAEIEQLPGVGRSTAAAIAAFCFDARVPILDGNVKRVLARHAGLAGDPAIRAAATRLWEHAQGLLPSARQMPAYTQGLMDLGATVCRRASPACTACPVQQDCFALIHDRVAKLPTLRKRKATPTRHAWFLLAIERDTILLEKRPATGIWGSLLAPPQFASIEAMRSSLDAIDTAAEVRALPARRHGFTHFTLAYTPYLARLSSPRPRLAEPGQRWVRLDDLGATALPAPIKKLLADVRALLARENARATSTRRVA